jgi:hypothetical protein
MNALVALLICTTTVTNVPGQNLTIAHRKCVPNPMAMSQAIEPCKMPGRIRGADGQCYKVK